MTDETYTKLLHAIREHSGLELATIRQAGEHGADAGWGGFTYYSDTCAFTAANRSAIMDAISDDADEFGQTVPEFIASWTCAQNGGMDDETGFDNGLAWYALEAVGRRLADRRECRA